MSAGAALPRQHERRLHEVARGHCESRSRRLSTPHSRVFLLTHYSFFSSLHSCKMRNLASLGHVPRIHLVSGNSGPGPVGPGSGNTVKLCSSVLKGVAKKKKVCRKKRFVATFNREPASKSALRLPIASPAQLWAAKLTTVSLPRK